MSEYMHPNQGHGVGRSKGRLPGQGPRKVVQIAMWQDGSDGYVVSVMYALCDDGTIWAHRPEYMQSERWERVKDIPAFGAGDAK